MTYNSQTVIVGNLGADPELRFTPSGIPVATLNVGVGERRRNAAGEWEDSGTTWYRVILWNQAAENVAESLMRGMRVMVSGTMRSRNYETKEGEKRTTWELTADEIGPTLRGQTVTVTPRDPRTSGKRSVGRRAPGREPGREPGRRARERARRAPGRERARRARRARLRGRRARLRAGRGRYRPGPGPGPG